MKKKLLSFLFVLLTIGLYAQDPPNILFILTDDMGYSDVGFNQVENSPVNDIVTPNLDQLADNGTVFTSAYAVHMFCGPSRAGIMTGRYPHKIGSQFNLASFSDHGVSGSETYFSQLLQNAGYYTGIIGKWHLGETSAFHPNNRGYDHFYGFLGGGHKYFSEDWRTVSQTEDLFANASEGAFSEYSVALERNGTLLDNPTENLYLTDMLTSEGVAFLDDAQTENKPFFLFMSYNAPHTLLEAKDSDIAALKAAPYNITFSDDNRATYSAMMYALDKQVKVLIDALKDKGMYDNTLIVFMSDNGGKLKNNASANNHPLSGGKGDIEEGGVRVPMFMHWPDGLTGAPSKFDHVVSGLDLYPTFVELANASVPAGKELDGVDIMDHVLANTDPRNDKAIFNLDVNTPNNYVMARKGKYKAKTYGDGTWLLYDLDADITEATTVNNAAILKELTDEAKIWAQTHITPLWFDNPDWGWEQKWTDENMPNWAQTFPDNIGELPDGIVPVSLKWKDGGTDDRMIAQAGEETLTFTYNSGVAAKAYLIGESKTGGNWGDIWYSYEVDIVPGNGNTIDIPLTVPADQEVQPLVRLYMATEDNGGWSKRITPHKVAYMDIIENNPNAPDPLVITSFTWEDGSKSGKEMPEETSINAKISYTNAIAGDKVYAILTYKDGGSYGASTAQIEVSLTEGDGEALISIPCRAFNSSNANANIARVILGSSSSAVWGNRIDVGNDEVSNNDVIYGAIASNGGGSNDQLVISTFTWEDDSRSGKEMPEGTTLNAKITYTGATAQEKVYAIISYKDGGDNSNTFTASYEQVEISLTEGDGEALVAIPCRAYSDANSNSNLARVTLGKTAAAVWGDRIDVAGDAAAGNDAIFGTIIINGTTDINHLTNSDVSIYPNPAKDVIHIKSLETGVINIISRSGSVVKSVEKNVIKSELPVSELSAGVYIIQLVANKGIYSQKIIITK